MKKFAKISVVILMITLVVSSFAVFASAAEASVSDEHKAIFEYYEAGYFLNATFNNAVNFEQQASFDPEMLKDSSDAFKAMGKVAYKNNEDGTAKVVSIAPVYFSSVTDKSISFGVNTKLKLDDAASSSVSLNLHSDIRDSIENETLKIFEITQDDILVYSGMDSGVPAYKSADISVAGSMVEIELFYEVTANGENITMNISNGDTTQAVSFAAVNFDFKSFDLGFRNVTFDYCEIYKGSFIRRLSDNSDDIAARLNAIANMYSANPSANGAFEYAEIAAKVLVDYEFYDEAVAQSAVTILNAVAPVYAERYVNAAANIDVTKPYYNCLDALAEVIPYESFINKLAGMSYGTDIKQTAEAMQNAKASIDAEYARLAKAKEDTILSYDVVYAIPNVYNATYATLKEANDFVLLHPICDTYYDDAHAADAVSLAYRYAESIKTEYNKKDAVAKAFIENIPVMCDTSKSYADRYAAYTVAKDNFFNDSTYNAYMQGGVTIEALVSSYNKISPSIKAVSDYAEAFLLKMDEATVTQSYAVRIAALDAAVAYIDNVEREYPGVKDALDKYYVLRQDIDKKFEIARNYITSVISIQSASTIEEKMRAIEVAKAYAALGADVSIVIADMPLTVMEANIILSNEESKLTLAQTHVNSYINAVNSISLKTDMSEKRSAINRALELQVGVDTTADGVVAATIALTEAVDNYNAEVAAANALAGECNTLALDTVARTIPTVNIAQIVAIVKKFYD